MVVTRSALASTIVVETRETGWELLLLFRLGSKVLELLNAVLIKAVPVVSVAGTVAVMVRVTLSPLARVGIAGQVTVLVVGLKVPPLSAPMKFKAGGSGS